MSRPESINDIPTYSRQGTTLITVHLNELAVSGKILAAAAALITAVEKTPGVSSVQEYGSITVFKDKTPEELTAAVQRLQTTWDDTQANFFRWEEDGVPADASQYSIQTVLSWATKEDQQTEFLTDALREAKIREASK